MKHLIFSMLLICVITTCSAQVRRVTFPATSVALYLPPATSSAICPLWFFGAGISFFLGSVIIYEAAQPCTPGFLVFCPDLTAVGVTFLVIGIPMVLAGIRCVRNKSWKGEPVTE